MKYLKYITILSFVIVLFFVSFRPASAQEMCFTNPDTGQWALCTPDPNSASGLSCIETGGGGSQEAYECCLSAGTSTCEAPTDESCFPAGTGITMADGTTKNIEDVKVGDKVQGFSNGGAKTTNTVQKLIQPVSDNMCEIKFDDEEALRVTNSHPLSTTEGWKAISVEAASKEKESVPVTELLAGDKMIKEDGSAPQVKSISCWSEKVQTYNFTVDNSSTYFAEGFLAHNKGGYAFPQCGAGTVPTGSVGSLPGGDFSCMTGASCGGWFVAKTNPDSECNIGRSDCIVSQKCCPAGQAVECGNIVSANDILPTDTYYQGYMNCPNSNDARVFATNRGGDGSQPDIYCRQNCSCKVPCGKNSGAAAARKV